MRVPARDSYFCRVLLPGESKTIRLAASGTCLGAPVLPYLPSSGAMRPRANKNAAQDIPCGIPVPETVAVPPIREEKSFPLFLGSPASGRFYFSFSRASIFFGRSVLSMIPAKARAPVP